MACTKLNLGDGMTAIVCTRTRSRRCYRCQGPSEYQCDFPIGKYKSGKKKGQTRTCDRHLCALCVKHGVTEGVDFCREHYPIAKANYEMRTQIK